MSEFLQETESHLAKQTNNNHILIQQILSQLNDAVVYNDGNSNVETNRKLWDNYAKAWNPSQPWYLYFKTTLFEIDRSI